MKKTGWIIFLSVVVIVFWRYESKKMKRLSFVPILKQIGIGSAPMKDRPETTQPSPPDRPLDESEFQNFAYRTLNLLPKKSEFKELNAEQVHEMPDLLWRAGIELGKIAKILHDQPALAHRGLAFYEACAGEAEYPTPVRALCVANYRDLSARSKVSSEDFMRTLPVDVRVLSNRIPQDSSAKR